MFSLSREPTPATRDSSDGEAVFTSTPTAFTQSSITASSERSSFEGLTSCWYWPTPMDFGSIFTSSASGSCSRRAMDTAPRRDTSSSGSSADARADAEYTEAPASDTTSLCRVRRDISAISSVASLSVSREAVPLPIAMSSTSWLSTIRESTASASSHFLAGACG